jgi:anaerobic selenocysteine-containing dehydrogenase
MLVLSDAHPLGESAPMSDFILPAAVWGEKYDLHNHWDWHTFMIGGDKAVEPLGEAKDEYHFWRELGIRMGQAAAIVKAMAEGKPYPDGFQSTRDPAARDRRHHRRDRVEPGPRGVVWDAIDAQLSPSSRAKAAI